MEERLPCPTCRQPVELEAELCLSCGARLLVDVVLRRPMADGRVRYRVARLLASQPGAPPLAAIQAGLAAAPATAARGVTRAFAHSALPLLAEQGLPASIEKSVLRQEGGGIKTKTALYGLAAAAIAGILFLGWQRVVDGVTPAKPPASDAPPRSTDAPRVPVSATSSRELAQRALGAAASLRCRDSVGSGFFVAPDLVLTNAHVLCSAGESVQVGLSDDQTLSGEVLRRDDRLDVGLIRVSGANVSPLPLGDVGEVAAGDRVMIVGSPVGLDFSVQEGSLSSVQRSANGVAYLQLDAKVSPGNSGGPVIDGQGRVVGIVAMKVTGQNVEGIGLAIPINYVYSPAVAFVQPPSPLAAGSPAFQRLLVRAQQGSDSGLGESIAEAPDAAAQDDGRPLLVAGRVDQYGNLVVRVVRITDYAPAFEEIAVTVSSGLDSFCTVKGDVREWQRADAVTATGLDSRAAAALRQIAAGRTMFVGESPLRWDLCDRTKMRSGIQIELQGARPDANKLIVR